MVKIYVSNISDLPDPKDHPEILKGLSKKRIEKTLRYRQVKDRKQSFGAGLLLKKCLFEYGIDMESIRYGENGKPEAKGIHFNISHSQDMVVCVVSNQPVGCDIENVDDLKEGIAERFFTDNEIRYLNTFSGDKKRDEFYRLWTMKESYMKMTGEGMSLALDKFEFIIESDVKVYRDGKLCTCNIREYEIQGYKLTVCAEEEEYIYEETKLDSF